MRFGEGLHFPGSLLLPLFLVLGFATIAAISTYLGVDLERKNYVRQSATSLLLYCVLGSKFEFQITL